MSTTFRFVCMIINENRDRGGIIVKRVCTNTVAVRRFTRSLQQELAEIHPSESLQHVVRWDCRSFRSHHNNNVGSPKLPFGIEHPLFG